MTITVMIYPDPIETEPLELYRCLAQLPKCAELLHQAEANGGLTICFNTDSNSPIAVDPRGFRANWDPSLRKITIDWHTGLEPLAIDKRSLWAEAMFALVEGLSLAANFSLASENEPNPLMYPDVKSYVSAMARVEYTSFNLWTSGFNQVREYFSPGLIINQEALSYEDYYNKMFSKVRNPDLMQSQEEYYKSVYFNSRAHYIEAIHGYAHALNKTQFLITDAQLLPSTINLMLSLGLINLEDVGNSINLATALLDSIACYKSEAALDPLAKQELEFIATNARTIKSNAEAFLNSFISLCTDTVQNAPPVPVHTEVSADPESNPSPIAEGLRFFASVQVTPVDLSPPIPACLNLEALGF